MLPEIESIELSEIHNVAEQIARNDLLQCIAFMIMLISCSQQYDDNDPLLEGIIRQQIYNHGLLKRKDLIQELNSLDLNETSETLQKRIEKLKKILSKFVG